MIALPALCIERRLCHHRPDHPTLWRATEPALRDGYPCYRRIGSAIESSGTPPNDGVRPARPHVTTGSDGRQ